MLSTKAFLSWAKFPIKKLYELSEQSLVVLVFLFGFTEYVTAGNIETKCKYKYVRGRIEFSMLR